GLSLGPKAYLAWRAASFLDGARMALHPGNLRDRMEQLREELARRYALPRIAARVGDAPVDAFSYEQGVVLLNRLNWTPRPIFQAYSAYTPYLQAINAQFFASESAPKYLIFQLLGFDGRLPVLEDGQALLEVVKRYHPVLTEGSNLLLERNRADAG